MADNDQAQADLSDSSPGVDPEIQDASHDPAPGATNLADYQASVDALLDEQGDEPAEEDVPAEEPEEEAGNGEEEGNETLPENEDEEEEPEPGPKSSNRFRFNSPEDQAVAAIAKAKGVSLVEAARLFAGENPAATVAETTEAERTLADVSTEYDAIRAERKAAMADLEFDKVADLDDKLETLRDEREALRVQDAREAVTKSTAEQTRYDTEWDQAEARAAAHYPDCTKPESALTKRINELDQQAKRLSDPIFHSPNKPFLLAQAAAKELGILMTDPKAKPAPGQKVTRRPVTPAGGNSRTSAPADTATKLETQIGQVATMEDYEKLAGSFGAGGF